MEPGLLVIIDDVPEHADAMRHFIGLFLEHPVSALGHPPTICCYHSVPKFLEDLASPSSGFLRVNGQAVRLILSDVMMPDAKTGGIAVYHRLDEIRSARTTREHRTLPKLVLTSNSYDACARELLPLDQQQVSLDRKGLPRWCSYVTKPSNLPRAAGEINGLPKPEAWLTQLMDTIRALDSITGDDDSWWRTISRGASIRSSESLSCARDDLKTFFVGRGHDVCQLDGTLTEYWANASEELRSVVLSSAQNTLEIWSKYAGFVLDSATPLLAALRPDRDLFFAAKALSTDGIWLPLVATWLNLEGSAARSDEVLLCKDPLPASHGLCSFILNARESIKAHEDPNGDFVVTRQVTQVEVQDRIKLQSILTDPTSGQPSGHSLFDALLELGQSGCTSLSAGGDIEKDSGTISVSFATKRLA